MSHGSSSLQNHPEREVPEEAGAALPCRILVLEKPLKMQEPQPSEATGRQSSALLQVLPTPCTDKANDEAAGKGNYIKGRDPFLQRWQKG